MLRLFRLINDEEISINEIIDCKSIYLMKILKKLID